MKNRTAIKILIEAYEKRKVKVEHGLLNCKNEQEKERWQSDLIVNDMILKDLNNSLHTERQIIEDAFEGARLVYSFESKEFVYPDAETYINKTFTTKTTTDGQ